MLNEAGAVADALGRETVVEVPITGTDEVAFAFECEPADVRAAWEVARAALSATGRWPLVVWQWDGHSVPGWLPDLAAERVQGRQLEAELRYATGDHTLGQPEFLVTVPEPEVALAPRLADLAADRYVEADIAAVLAQTASQYGLDPSVGQVHAAVGPEPPVLALERWLLDWESARVATGPPPGGHLDGFGAGGFPAVVLLPVANGWDSLVHFDFYPSGGEAGAVGRLMAVVGSWHERFGAELFANQATMLHFVVERPPSTVAEAWTLAVEQVAVAPDTTRLAGVPLRRHAQALVGRRTWFLHNRP